MWMITWFVVAEEAQSGKQKNHSAAASGSRLAHFYLFFNKELIEKRVITAHTLPLWDRVIAVGRK